MFLTVAAAGLMFVNLGASCLWADEGDTAVLARSILSFGVPTAWDGVSLVDSDEGRRLNRNLVMVTHPWLPYYACAASQAVFGDTTFGARFPFALAGVLTVVLLYRLMLAAGCTPTTAALAALLLLVSVQYLIYCRHCRHYGFNSMLVCAALTAALRLDRWSGRAAFALLTIALFHSHPIPAISVCATVAVLTATNARFRPGLVGFWMMAPTIAAATIPWFMFSRRGLQANSELPKGFGDLFSGEGAST